MTTKILINLRSRKETKKEAQKREKKLRQYAFTFRVTKSQLIRDLIDDL